MQPIGAHVGHERNIDVEAWDGIVTWRTLISADRTPTSTMTAGVAEIEPGASEVGAEHHHADHEIYYFLAGSGEVVLDGTPHPVEAGSVVFVPGHAPLRPQHRRADLAPLLRVRRRPVLRRRLSLRLSARPSS